MATPVASSALMQVPGSTPANGKKGVHENGFMELMHKKYGPLETYQWGLVGIGAAGLITGITMYARSR